MESLFGWCSCARPARLSLLQWRWKRRSPSVDSEHIKLVEHDEFDNADLQLERQQSSRQRRQFWIKAGVFAMCLAAALLVLSQLPIKTYLIDISAWIKENKFLGTFVAIFIFCLAIPLCIPSTIIEAISGSLFGVSHGVVVILLGKTGGSLVAFLLGRHIGKAVIGDYLATKFPTFRALSQVLNKKSWKPLILFQLSSIPNLVKCYGLAITNVSPSRFAASTLVAGTPHAVIWANIGSQASDIAAIVSGQSELSSGKLVLLVGGAILTIFAMAFLVIYTKRELQELQKLEYASGSEEEGSPITIDSGPRMSLHSEENELIKIRSSTNC